MSTDPKPTTFLDRISLYQQEACCKQPIVTHFVTLLISVPFIVYVFKHI